MTLSAAPLSARPIASGEKVSRSGLAVSPHRLGARTPDALLIIGARIPVPGVTATSTNMVPVLAFGIAVSVQGQKARARDGLVTIAAPNVIRPDRMRASNPAPRILIATPYAIPAQHARAQNRTPKVTISVVLEVPAAKLIALDNRVRLITVNRTLKAFPRLARARNGVPRVLGRGAFTVFADRAYATNRVPLMPIAGLVAVGAQMCRIELPILRLGPLDPPPALFLLAS